MKKYLSLLIGLLCLAACRPTPEKGSNPEYISQAFVHPGMMQDQEDLDYMRQQITAGAEPWKTAFANLKDKTSLDFTPQPFTEISVGAYGANSIGGREFSQSADAVYNHALMWYITGDKAYAEKAIEILNAWSYVLRGFDANNAKLNVGLSGFYFLNAAEILKHTDSGWAEKDLAQFTRMVLTVFYPTIKDFFTEANGNWDASMICTMMCIGIFTDNADIFNRAVERFYRGEGNSGITRYIYPGGQCQETTRDWDHVQLGLGEFAKAAQVAHTQGLDFFSVADERIAQGFEHACRYLSDEEIELYGVFTDRKKEHTKDIFEFIYQYYKNRKGIILPYTEKVIFQRTRPKSSVALLTAIKAPVNELPVPTDTFAFPQPFLSPQAVGALKGQWSEQPENSLFLQPGQDIQAAIDAHKGENRWIVLEAGVHTLTAPLKIYSGTRLAGRGFETILFAQPGLETTLINGEDTISDIIIRDILIEGATKVVENADPNHDRRGRSYMSAPSREGIILRSTRPDGIKQVLLENLTVQNFTKHGVAIVGGEDIRIRRCNFSDNGANVVPGAGLHHNLHLSYLKGCDIVESRFDTSPFGNGINVTFCSQVSVTNCETGRNGLSGIRFAESQQIKIIGNLCEGNGENGIFIERQLDPCTEVEIKGNTMQNNRLSGLEASTAQSLSTSDNRCLHNSETNHEEY